MLSSGCDLFGTDPAAGTFGQGTGFELSGTGHITLATLASFAVGDLNGAEPEAPLLIDDAGNRYGTNSADGANGFGTVFELSADHRPFTVEHNFNGTDGAGPIAGLTADLAGNLYGTTGSGGANDDGTAFELSATDSSLSVTGADIPPAGLAEAAMTG